MNTEAVVEGKTGGGVVKRQENWNILHNQEEHMFFQAYCQWNLISFRTRTQSCWGFSYLLPQHTNARQFHSSLHRFQGGILETDIKGIGAGSPEQVMLSEGGEEPHEKQENSQDILLLLLLLFLKSSEMSFVWVLV